MLRSAFVVALLSLMLPYSHACGIRVPSPVNTTLYGKEVANLHVFKGTVVRDISDLPAAVQPDGLQVDMGRSVRYIVQVMGRVYKGCSLKSYDRILVTSSGPCSAVFALNSTYLFTTDQLKPLDATHRAMLGNRTKVKQTFFTNVETDTKEWFSAVSGSDKADYRAYKRMC